MSLESIYDYDTYGGASGVDFSRGDPVDVFARLQIFVEYDADGRERKLVTTTVPGHPGPWILAYSAVEKLHLAKHETDVEYSAIPGRRLLATMRPGTGVWFDHEFPGGRKILLPAADLSIPDLPETD
jgi:hypothetical protein